MGPIWMNSGTYGYFFTLIPMVQKFLEFSHSLRYFFHLQDWGRFSRFHSTGYVKGAENLCIGINFHAESHDQKSFSKFENFTLFRSKVWNLPFQILHQPIEREADTMMGVNSRVQQNMKQYELYKMTMVFLSNQTMLFFLEHFALELVMDQKPSFRSHGQRIADCLKKTNGRYRKQIWQEHHWNSQHHHIMQVVLEHKDIINYYQIIKKWTYTVKDGVVWPILKK